MAEDIFADCKMHCYKSDMREQIRTVVSIDL